MPWKRQRMESQAAEIAVRHLMTLEFLHTKVGTKLHMRGCHWLKERDKVKATSRSKGSEGKPIEKRQKCCARIARPGLRSP